MTARKRLDTVEVILLVSLTLAGAATLSMTDAVAQGTNQSRSNVTITVAAMGTTTA
jgi:hypothetical protein